MLFQQRASEDRQLEAEARGEVVAAREAVLADQVQALTDLLAAARMGADVAAREAESRCVHMGPGSSHGVCPPES